MRKFIEVLVEEKLPNKNGTYIVKLFGCKTYESRYYEIGIAGDSYWIPYVESWLKEEDNAELKNIDWLMARCETSTERYIEAEEFILNLKWWERLFISRKIDNFIKSRLTKYEF